MQFAATKIAEQCFCQRSGCLGAHRREFLRAMTQAPLTIIQGQWCINPKTDLEQKLPTPRLIKKEIMTPTKFLDWPFSTPRAPHPRSPL